MAQKLTTIKGAQRNLNWWRDTPDHRDLLYRPSVQLKGRLPDRVDLAAGCPAVEDQGALGSCTACASTSAMEFLFKKLKGADSPAMSRLFNYYMTRVTYEHVDPTDDSGAEIRNVMKSLHKFGSCVETLWPYDITKFSTVPPDPAKADALTHQIILYRKLPACAMTQAIKRCLVDGYPVVGGFVVPESALSDAVATTGVVPYPTQDETIVGGHAIMIVGYADDTKTFKFQNSWGTSWGKAGYGYLPYQYADNWLLMDCWTIRNEETGSGTTAPRTGRRARTP